MNIQTLAHTAVVTTAVVAATLTATTKVLAQDSILSTSGTWNGSANDGSWANSGNWVGGIIPSGADAVASFPLSVNTSVQLPDTAVTIGTITGTTNFTLLTAAGQTFTLKDASGFGGTIDLQGGTLSLAGTGSAVISNLLATSLSTIEVQNTGATVLVARASGTAELDKTGAGFLRLCHASMTDRQNANVVLQAGSFELAATEIPSSVLNQAWFHIDASQTNTMTLTTDNGKNYITRLDDVRANGRYATPPNTDFSTANAPHAPWLQDGFQNGHPVIDFGSPAGNDFKTNGVIIGPAGGWGGCLNWSERCTEVRSVFLIISDREECANLSGAWPLFLGDTNSFNFLRDSSAKLFHSGNSSAAVREGEILLDGKSVTYATPFSPIGFHSLTLVTTGGVVNANTFSRDRSNRYGGQRLAEAVIYTNTLESADLETVQFSLAAKWLPQLAKSTSLTLAGGSLVIPAGTTLYASNMTVTADTTVTGGGTLIIQSAESSSGTLTTDGTTIQFAGDVSFDTLSIDTSNLNISSNFVAKFGTLASTSDTLVKQGSGTAICGFVDGTTRSINVEEGTVQLTGWPFDTWFHIDASQTNTMTFSALNGTNFITRLNDVRGNGRYATPPSGSSASSAYSPRPPWLQGAFQNNLPVIDFGAPSGEYKDSTGANLGNSKGWGGCLNWSERCLAIRSVFMVTSDREEFSGLTSTWPFFLGDTSTYHFIRGGSAVIFNGNADSGLQQGKILFDGNSVAYTSTFLPIGFHTLALIPTNAVTAGTFASDRGRRYGGQRLAEAVIYTNELSAAMQTNILNYFNAKWFGTTVTNGVGYSFDALTVAAGATLDIGLSPMSAGVSTANSLTGEGTVKTATLAVKALSPAGSGTIGNLTVDGNLTLATNAVVTLDTSATELDTVTVSGTLAIEPNGVFNVGILSTVCKAPSTTAIITADSVTGAENLKSWKCTGDLAKRYSCRAIVENGTVYLKVSSKGTIVMVM